MPQAQLPTELPYPANPPVACSFPLGVTALWLAGLNITGPLPSLSALAPSLEVSCTLDRAIHLPAASPSLSGGCAQVMDLSGATLGTACVAGPLMR